MSTAPPPKTLDSTPPEAWPSLLRVVRLAGRPRERVLRIEAASGKPAGVLVERSVLTPLDVSGAARTADEAEGSTVA